MVGNFFGVSGRLVVDVGLVQQCGNLLLGLIGRPLFQQIVDFNLALGLYPRVMLGILLRRLAITNDLTQAGKALIVINADPDVGLLLLFGGLGLRGGGLAALAGAPGTQLGFP